VSNPNQHLLDEVNRARSWFPARKTRSIWARMVERPLRVKTLEGEQDVPAGSMLCRGGAGDMWPQKPDRLAAKYTPTDEVTSDGWRKYEPQPEGNGVMAAQVAHAFVVHHPEWGKFKGKAGDYLVKNAEDEPTAHPADVWVVDRALFEATYERGES
jgi:hypothetical protein